MRKLVTLRKISKIIDIAGSDFIALAVVDGWQVIVKKTEFREGDDCLFFEIDSFIPATDERFKFLDKTTKYLGKDGYRLKTMKLRGALSQGLALPLSLFPEIIDRSLEDYSEQLGIIKYDVANQVGSGNVRVGNAEGQFPSFIPKTDQERIQNVVSYFSTMAEDEFEATLKLDGSSMTCYKVEQNSIGRGIIRFMAKLVGLDLSPKYHFGVCSRNLELKRVKSKEDRQSDFWTAAKYYEIEKKLPLGYAVQGELIGPKIGGNNESVDELKYYIFDVYDINAGKYLLPNDRRHFCNAFGLPHVPVVKAVCQPLLLSLSELLLSVEGESMNKGTVSEGQVFKHTTKDVSFKVISNKYLLKKEK